MSNQSIGKLGEQYAAQFLASKNHQIIHSNYSCKYGEIDLIALKEKSLIFVEVKTRRSNYFGSPKESITRKKLSNIVKTGLHFLNQSRKKQFTSWRIDLIAIELEGNSSLKNISHLISIHYG